MFGFVSQCLFCNVNFRCKKEKERHESTKKHINTITINGNNNNTIIGNNNNINQYFNQNLNVAFPLNTFKNSNLDLIKDYHINEFLDKNDCLFYFITWTISLDKK